MHSLRSSICPDLVREARTATANRSAIKNEIFDLLSFSRDDFLPFKEHDVFQFHSYTFNDLKFRHS